MPVSNPADLWPAMERHMETGLDVYGESLNAVMADPGVDAVLLSTFAGNFPIFLDLADTAARSRKSGKPIFVWITGQQGPVLEFQKKARDIGVPVFQELHRAVECLAAVLNPRQGHGVSEGIDQPDGMDLPPDLDEMVREMEGPLDEHLSKRYLQACGIPTVKEVIVEDIDSFKNAAEELGFPLVMKGLMPGGIHKTEMGLVRLNIQGKDAARRVFRELMKRMKGEGKVLLQQQVEGKVELILGLIRDPQFGPCVMFGLGGVMAEIFQDTAFAMAPLTLKDALDLISRIKGQKLLNGFRGAPPVNREELAGILSALGAIGLRDRRIKEIDINPLMITSSGAVAVDATIIL
jgi:acetyltransferase